MNHYQKEAVEPYALPMPCICDCQLVYWNALQEATVARFPTIRGPFLGVPRMRIIAYRGLYWVPFFWQILIELRIMVFGGLFWVPLCWELPYEL